MNQTEGSDNGGRRRNSTAIRAKPTMEIYRPPSKSDPNVRIDNSHINARLNVHAKEFKMRSGLHSSKSHNNITSAMTSLYAEPPKMKPGICQSKSNTNLPLSLQQSKSAVQMPAELQRAMSYGSMLVRKSAISPRVHFKIDPEVQGNISPTISAEYQLAKKFPQKSPSGSVLSGDGIMKKEIKTVANMGIRPLKRSKSLTSADMGRHSKNRDSLDVSNFPLDIQGCFHRAETDPNLMTARSLMELPRYVMTKVLESVQHALRAAKFCISIIEVEKNETFLEALLNTCTQWYAERERLLRGGTNPTHRYCAYMQFLNEMYCQLKCRQMQLKTEHEGDSPDSVLLKLLSKCCQDCVKYPVTQGETDSLFFVLTSVGRDLQNTLPVTHHLIRNGIRDAFLESNCNAPVRRKLLQLIELQASNWQMPASAVAYYTATK